MAYADYTFYATSYLGNKVPEADFPRVALRASEYIDIFTFGRLIDDATLITDQVKKACCALAELIYLYEQQSETGDAQKTSEAVGDYKVTYAAVTDSNGHAVTLDEKKNKLLRQYLGSTGLLYRGW